MDTKFDTATSVKEILQIMLKLTKGHTVSKPELIEEGYMLSSDVSIIANVDADKIKDVLQHFIVMHEEPMFFILELPVTCDREERVI